jgi:D-alanyl-D-alanine carboxypeptidase (penicillin-binding protein 5/6)
MTILRAYPLRLRTIGTLFMVMIFLLQPLRVHGAETLVSPIAGPAVSAQAIYVMDATSGIPLYSKNPDERRPIGSVVKIMTALVTLKYVENPDKEQVKIIESDPVDPIYSKMNVQVGDTLTVTQLLYGLMLPSGGDAANALCRHVGAIISGIDGQPSIACESFVNAMNAYAAELGLDNSRFTNPDGRDADNAYSSAQDVYLMTEAMTRNDKLMSVIQNPAYRFDSVGPENREYAADSTLAPHLTNGVIGGKTGSEEDAGANVALIREVNGGSNNVIIVVMGATLQYDENSVPIVDTRWDDVNTIISAMDSQFTWTDPSQAGVIPGLSEQMTVWDVSLQNPPAIPLPSGAGVNIAFQMQVGPVVEPGEPAGTLYLFYGDTPVGDLPLYQAEIGWTEGQAAR